MKIYDIFLKILIKNKSVKKCELVDEPFENVCFFSNTALGDTIFNTPIFRTFKQNFPNVKTTALLNPSTASLFKTDPNLDEILTYDGKMSGFFKIAKVLKNNNFDIIFILHSNEPQATPLAVLSGAKYIFKLPNLKSDFAKFHSNRSSGFDDDTYIVLNRLRQLEFVGIKSSDTRLNLYLNDSDFKGINEILECKENEKLIGFQMGASTRSRQWFSHRWSELAKLILSQTNHKIILTGSPNERIMAENFRQSFKDEIAKKRILNLAGKFNLRSACALISKLNVLITPDTGPLHVAAALKTPTIGLFAVANPIASNPNFDTDIHKFIKKPRTCEPCIAKRCKYQKCMLQIEANEVYKLLKELI